jgi:hypothetical protein
MAIFDRVNTPTKDFGFKYYQLGAWSVSQSTHVSFASNNQPFKYIQCKSAEYSNTLAKHIYIQLT